HPLIWNQCRYLHYRKRRDRCQCINYFLKRMKNLWYRLLSGILVLLGLPACGEIGFPGSNMAEYGTPYADYTIKGKVINPQKESIPDIQVIVKEQYSAGFSSNCYPVDTLYTSVNGTFEYHNPFVSPETSYRIVFKDIDGKKNGGVFKTDSIIVSMGKATDGKGWYQGKAVQEKTIELKNEI
ncbi:hypothetical protein EZS27_035420, partial [termite gut metagenome]